MAWTIEYSETARKHIRKLDHQTRSRIRTLLESRVARLDDPRAAGKALQGPLSTFWVYRAGDYRIICDIQDAKLVILVVATGYRSTIYN